MSGVVRRESSNPCAAPKQAQTQHPGAKETSGCSATPMRDNGYKRWLLSTRQNEPTVHAEIMCRAPLARLPLAWRGVARLVRAVVPVGTGRPATPIARIAATADTAVHTVYTIGDLR